MEKVSYESCVYGWVDDRSLLKVFIHQKSTESRIHETKVKYLMQTRAFQLII